MSTDVYSEIKDYLSFDERDVANLRALAEPLDPLLPEVVEKFYDVIRKNPLARQVFKGGEPQIKRQQQHLLHWVRNLFVGSYDEAHFDSRSRIGRAHVDVFLPQHLMISAMEVVRREIEERIYLLDIPDGRAKAASLNKLISFELGSMLEAYKQHYSARIRHDERELMEEKLTQSEHMARIGQLAASLAHAIKNPLAGISGAIQVIGGSLPRESPHRAIVEEMLAQIDRLDHTVRDLLVYSRPKAPALASVELNELIARVLNVLREEPNLRRLRVVHSRKCELPRVLADERQLEQVVMNLLLNAADASEEGQKITITTSLEGGRIRLVITDQGAGMSEENLARAFDAFHTTKTRGTGLGLPITRQIVEAHGGQIDIESQRQKGTTVTVELPAPSQHQDGDSRPHHPAAVS